MSQDLTDLRKKAYTEATSHSACSLSNLGLTYFPDLKPSGKGAVLDVCPYCQEKKKFGLWNYAKYWGCQKDSCPASIETLKGMSKLNAVGMMMYVEGIEFKDAARKMCELAGVHFPEMADLTDKERKNTAKKATKAVKKEAKKAAVKVEKSPLIKMPDIGKNPWEEIYCRLTLRDEDRATMKQKRGFTDKTITLNGYRSSISANRPILNEVIKLFPEDQLLELGIVLRDKETSELKINAQLCGYGLKKRGSGKEDDDFGWTEPILIPYIGANGRITYIRPHKGGISPKAYMEEKKLNGVFYYSKAISHPYGEHLVKHIQEKGSKKWATSAVLTEGEFCIAALGQAKIPALGVPGIQMPRNPVFLKELVKTIESLGIKNVRTIFDNDDKSHIEDPWYRYDVDVYALYAAHQLKSNGIFSWVGQLPDEWRIGLDGKPSKSADWDGRLAYLVNKHGASEGNSLANKEFKKVYFASHGYDGQLPLWDSMTERQRVTNCKVRKLTYDQKVGVGGAEEKRQIKILRKCPEIYKDLLGVWSIIHSLEESIGCYYDKKYLPKEERQVIAKQKKEIVKAQGEGGIDIDERAGYEAALLACNLLLGGIPEKISNFTISCEYTILTRDGLHERLFIITNTNGVKSSCCQPESKDLSSPTKFREFLYSRGNFSWLGGQKVLDLLMLDLGVESEWRQIKELDTIGLDLDSGLYILGDCAFGKEPFEVIFPDKENIIWNHGTGYRIDPDDLNEFAHKVPPMMFQSETDETPQQVFQKILDDPEAERKKVTSVLEQFMGDMIGTTGGLEGVMLVCAALAYAVAPETIRKYNSQLGIWLHGQMSAGKTDTARQLMSIWGYILTYDIPTLGEGTTNVGMDRLMAQYCSWMMHLDEFREDEANKAKVASLRNAYNRQSKNKGRIDQSKKTKSYTPLTMPVVTGESTTTDAATKSRFVSIVLSSEKRIGTPEEQADRYTNMMLNAEKYHIIGRWIMLNRKTFAKAVMKELALFLADQEVCETIPSARLRTTYGPAYATFMALESIFCISSSQSSKDKFRSFTLKHVATASQEVAQVNFSTKFWDDVASLYKRDRRTHKYMRVAFCTWQEGSKTPILCPDPHNNEQPEGSEPCVVLNGKTIHDLYSADKRSRGETPELNYQNLMSQLKQQKAWVSSDRSHRVTLHKGSPNLRVWIIRINSMDEATKDVFLPMVETILEPEPADEHGNTYDASDELAYIAGKR